MVGVDERCVQRAVAQHVGNFLERTAAFEEPAGHRVA